jgi:hypothetical protein
VPDARNATAPPRFEVSAPARAPNILIILIDEQIVYDNRRGRRAGRQCERNYSCTGRKVWRLVPLYQGPQTRIHLQLARPEGIHCRIEPPTLCCRSSSAARLKRSLSISSKRQVLPRRPTNEYSFATKRHQNTKIFHQIICVFVALCGLTSNTAHLL